MTTYIAAIRLARQWHRNQTGPIIVQLAPLARLPTAIAQALMENQPDTVWIMVFISVLPKQMQFGALPSIIVLTFIIWI